MGDQFLVKSYINFKATIQDKTSILNEVNQLAKILINTTNTKDTKSCFNSFIHLVDFYIDQNRPTLAMKLLNKLVRYTDNQNRVVGHKYKLKLLVYCKHLLIYSKYNKA